MITREDIDKLFPPFDGEIWEPARKWMEESCQETLDRLNAKVITRQDVTFEILEELRKTMDDRTEKEREKERQYIQEWIRRAQR